MRRFFAKKTGQWGYEKISVKKQKENSTIQNVYLRCKITIFNTVYFRLLPYISIEHTEAQKICEDFLRKKQGSGVLKKYLQKSRKKIVRYRMYICAAKLQFLIQFASVYFRLLPFISIEHTEAQKICEDFLQKNRGVGSEKISVKKQKENSTIQNVYFQNNAGLCWNTLHNKNLRIKYKMYIKI